DDRAPAGHDRVPRRLVPLAPRGLDPARGGLEIRIAPSIRIERHVMSLFNGRKKNGILEPAGSSAKPPAIIEMKAIRKVYDTGAIQVEALKGVDLVVHPKEFVAIVGPSGSGKSTLLNLVGCLDVPSGGSYRLDGEEVAELDVDEL